jgi:hypothetical protein
MDDILVQQKPAGKINEVGKGIVTENGLKKMIIHRCGKHDGRNVFKQLERIVECCGEIQCDDFQD